jgi:hypothetical protein
MAANYFFDKKFIHIKTGQEKTKGRVNLTKEAKAFLPAAQMMTGPSR